MTNNRIASFIGAIVVVACSIAAVGQQTLPPSGPQGTLPPRGTFVIRNARIVTVSGAEIPNGSVVIRDGKIAAVAATVSAPAGATVIDARGLSVYPGMIDANTQMGIVEIGQGANGTVDTSEVGDINPNAAAIIAVSPHSAHIAVTRVNGVTTVLTLPTGGTISGQAAIINLVGSSQSEMAVVPYAAMALNFPRVAGGGGGFGGFGGGQQQAGNIADAIAARDRSVENLRKLFRDAEAYRRAHDAYAKDKSLPRPDVNPVLASMVPYVRGERPFVFRLDAERDIRAAVKFADEMKIKVIILGGDDAWKVGALLKEKNIPVIVTGVLDLPSREDDVYDKQYELAARLLKAGVKFCISANDSGAHTRDLPYHAGMAASFGLAKDEALKAVTIYAAEILGLGSRMGSIEVGKDANIVITDGDILEARTKVRHVFIDGRAIPMNSRHTELYDMFKTRK